MARKKNMDTVEEINSAAIYDIDVELDDKDVELDDDLIAPLADAKQEVDQESVMVLKKTEVEKKEATKKSKIAKMIETICGPRIVYAEQ